MHFRVFTLRNLWYCSAGLWCSQLSYFKTISLFYDSIKKTKHAAVKDAKKLKKPILFQGRDSVVCVNSEGGMIQMWSPQSSLSLPLSEKVFSVLLLSVLTHLFPTSIRPHQHLWVVPASAARLPQPYRPFERRRSRHVPAPARGV